MKKITIMLLLLLLVTFSFANNENVQHYVNLTNSADLVNPDGFFEYMIVNGDCLWFLADRFYNDPFKWSKINEANPYIIDPDWIYPNNWLVIPSVFADDSGKPIYSGVAPESLKKVISEPITPVVIDDETKTTKEVEVAAIATTAELVELDETYDKSSVETYCGKPGWKIGLHAGYPVGDAPEDENLNLGLLLGTPFGIKVGPLSVGIGAGAYTFDFDKYYFGGGILASLCINDLLKLDMPLILQLHGTGFYVFGEENGPGFSAIGSGSIPLGKTPLSLGLYGAFGKYYPGDFDYNWSNVGAVIYYSL